MDNKYQNYTKEPEGYYFNNETKEYKQCYNSCKTCDKEGNNTNHNCKICKEGFNLEIHYENYKNCYERCEYYYYFDEINNISKCTKKLEFPAEYNKLILEEKNYIDNCTKDINYKYEFQNQCYKTCPNNSMERNDIIFIRNIIYDRYFCKPICDKLNPFENY